MNTKLIVFTALFLLLGCDDSDSAGVENDVSIAVSPEELNVDYEASTRTVTVTANADWGIYSSESWCTLSPGGGIAGTTTLGITVAENKDEDSRTAVLTFKSGTFRQDYTVTQGFNENREEPDIPTPDGYELVWQDEFNDSRTADGKAALPNTSEWWYETGNSGWGNNELENYIAAYSGSDTCAMIDDGTLKIIARKSGSEVLSVRMNTSKSWTYGYFEALLKLPGGKGTWPAFWMMPKNYTAWPDDGEIDIMEEVGYRPNWVSSSIHCKAYYHSIGTQKTAETYIATAESEFHVYAVEWTADYIKGYADGEVYFEFYNDGKNNKDTWPFYNPFYLKLNLAWGGNWGGAEGVDESVLPAVYEVDYVRVFQKDE